jgi:hypothetical protein
MSQLFAFLIAVGLTLTAYFGVAAWRVSESSDMDITAQIPLTARKRLAPSGDEPTGV